MALLSRKEFIKIDIRLGHSLSYRQANAMTWTVSFHFPSNNVVLLTRNYSNQLQPIYNNSLTLNTPKNNKTIYCKYCRNPLWHFHSFRSHCPRMVFTHSGVFYPELTSWSCTWRMNRWKLSLCFYDSESPWTAWCCCLLRGVFLSAGVRREQCLYSKQGVNEPFSCL